MRGRIGFDFLFLSFIFISFFSFFFFLTILAGGTQLDSETRRKDLDGIMLEILGFEKTLSANKN
jgi:hypothetical protein